ncbi:MAG: lipid-A-disaccharide synthase [Planctomycetes bacterium]|nr:lipid-A-disaccharide synthase [Planctomycetota bacterium]
MTDEAKEYRIFISAAEQSGDTHCAHLIAAIQERNISVEFVGTGGPKMEAAGCRLLASTADQAAMTYNAFAEVATYWKLVRRIRDYFQKNRVDLVVLCDSHAYNIHVAKAARKAGIPTLFYVAPQYWAWAEWRIRKLRRCCDRLCCILPFEEQWFTERGIHATFVSNPLLDDVSTDLSPCVKDYADFDPRRVKVALIPGSRKAEIETLWQPMQQIALALKRRYPEAELTVVAASQKREEALRKAQLPGLACRYTVDSVRDTALQSDFALVTSGSATLEVASAGCPLIVMYQMSRILWHGVGRWLVKSKLLSLVNLLAGRHLVPEFMPYFSSVDPIIAKAIEMIDAPQALARLSQELIGITQPLAAKRTRDEVASIALEMLRSRA